MAYRTYFHFSYLPAKAKRLSNKRARKQRQIAPKNTKILTFELKHLTENGLSSVTITGTLSKKYAQESIPKETIYGYIYAKKFKPKGIFAIPHKPLSSNLPLARKKRMKLNGRRFASHGHIHGSISLKKRPKYIAKRENNLLIGKQAVSLANILLHFYLDSAHSILSRIR